jgi:hypothetical protein
MPLQTAAAAQPKIDAEDERRRGNRRPHVCEAWLRSPTDPGGEKIAVLSLDISRHGFGFEAHQPVTVDCFYWVEIGIGEQRIAQEVRVVSCVESDGTPGVYRVGAVLC